MEGARFRAEREAKLKDLRIDLIQDLSSRRVCVVLQIESKGTEENTLAQFASRCWSSSEDQDDFPGTNGTKMSKTSKTGNMEHVEHL